MESNQPITPYESASTSCRPISEMAWEVGFEPTIMVLETTALDQTKLHPYWRRMKESNHQLFSGAVFKTVCRPATPSSNFGGPEKNRTPDPLNANQMLSQLSYWPKMIIRQHTNIMIGVLPEPGSHRLRQFINVRPVHLCYFTTHYCPRFEPQSSVLAYYQVFYLVILP